MGYRRTAIAALGAAMLCLTLPANAASVRGTVSAGASAKKPPPRYVTRTAQNEKPSSNATGIMIAVALVPLYATDPPTPPDTPLVIAQENVAFVPDILIVPVGGVVSFPNRDAIFHNVFSYSPPRSFDLGRYPQGETRTVTFDTPGIVRLFCEIHSSMYASIVVVNSNHYQIVPSGSEFVFDDVPPGKYRLIAADARGRHSMREFTLTKGDTPRLALALE